MSTTLNINTKPVQHIETKQFNETNSLKDKTECNDNLQAQTTTTIKNYVEKELDKSKCKEMENVQFAEPGTVTKLEERNQTKDIGVNNSYISKYPLLSGYVETKIFEMKNENSTIRITPKQLQFKFNTDTMEVEKGNKELKILNISSSPTKILVLPRQTEHFKFDYLPLNWLVPGIALVIKVTFMPTTPRPYYDWLRVCCASDSNLMIPITAVASHLNSLNIPEKINFGFVAIGERAVYKMTIHPIKNEIIKFMFIIVKETLGCEITPSQGKVEDKPVDIIVSYCPSCYITVSIPVQLFIPPLMMTPHYFTIEAYTKPMEKLSGILPVLPCKQDYTSKKKTQKINPGTRTTDYTKKDKVLPRCPLKEEPINKQFTQHEINMMLMQKELELRDPEEQLGPYGIYVDEMENAKSSGYKTFINNVKELRNTNAETMLLHSKERIFEIRCPDKDREQMLNEHLALWEQYRTFLNPVNKSDHPVYIRQKIIRRYKEKPMKTDCEENDLWKIRRHYLWTFIQSCRKVLIQNRMLHRLAKFKSLTPEAVMELEEKEY